MIRNLKDQNSSSLMKISCASTPSTITINIDNTMSSQEIQNMIDSIGKYIPYGHTILLQFADGTYTLTNELLIENFYGGGTLQIYGNATEFILSTPKSVILQTASSTDCIFRINGCYAYIQIFGIQMQKTVAMSGSTDGVIIINNTNYVYIIGCHIKAFSTVGCLLRAIDNSKCELVNTYTTLGNIRFYAARGSFITMWNSDYQIIGTSTTYAYVDGGFICGPNTFRTSINGGMIFIL